MSSEKFDLYQELEIEKTATPEEIKKAYKKLAMRWHPDKNHGNPDATEKFQRISHAYSILSDPKKKQYYDKYGTVDEDNFNFEEFMKGFSFDYIFDMFDGDFGKKMEQMMGGGLFEGRHNMKLMYIRKKANGDYPKIQEEDDKETFPRFIYGAGNGLESCKHLQFWVDKEETDWETDDESGPQDTNKEDDGEECEEIEDEEDLIEIFTLDNCKEEAGGKYSCNFCKEVKKLTFKKIKAHFIEKHKNEFQTYFGEDANWDEAVKNSKREKKAGNNPFGGMPFMDMNAMFDMGQMFGGNPKETEKMMKDFEKMMFGGMGMGMGGMSMEDMDQIFGGMGGMPGGKKKGGKKKK